MPVKTVIGVMQFLDNPNKKCHLRPGFEIFFRIDFNIVRYLFFDLGHNYILVEKYLTNPMLWSSILRSNLARTNFA